MMIPVSEVPDFKLIVGCVRDSQIHVGMGALQLFASGLYDKLVTLAEAKFMAAYEFGGSWQSLVDATPILCFDNNGIPCFVEGGIAQPKAVLEPADESHVVVLESEIVS